MGKYFFIKRLKNQWSICQWGIHKNSVCMINIKIKFLFHRCIKNNSSSRTNKSAIFIWYIQTNITNFFYTFTTYNSRSNHLFVDQQMRLWILSKCMCVQPSDSSLRTLVKALLWSIYYHYLLYNMTYKSRSFDFMNKKIE
jgi:hypothetical protein